MIQRIQTIYLFLIVIFQGLLFATALATFTSYESSFNLSLMGFYKLSSAGQELLINSYALMALNIVVVIYTLFIIFSYKNRSKQIKLAAFNFLLLCGFIVVMFYSFDNAKSFLDRSFSNEGAEISTTYGIGMILPLLSLIFNFLAIKGIRKDEELVKSADRIR
jgi:hypothetical protein